jgi:hypothetical protein
LPRPDPLEPPEDEREFLPDMTQKVLVGCGRVRDTPVFTEFSRT